MTEIGGESFESKDRMSLREKHNIISGKLDDRSYYFNNNWDLIHQITRASSVTSDFNSPLILYIGLWSGYILEKGLFETLTI
ncbi:3050_t:CDS:2 [Diversispora eburnea]|uniref:3050_t:CDS:1 n=1 Tax=Diversispora eburnea TaxID=1213867 RepID=A0A9N8YQC1_9GLOM|nr:3050_t:CDS:2 [Diversispora eburnea]